MDYFRQFIIIFFLKLAALPTCFLIFYGYFFYQNYLENCFKM